MKTKIQHNNVSDVAKTIQQYIAEKGYAPGDRIPTLEALAQKLGVGSRQLREGLSILKHQGFLVSRFKQGTVVASPKVEALCDTIDWHLDAAGCTPKHLIVARARLESVGAIEASRNRSARDLLIMLDSMERMEALAKADKPDEEVEIQFHTSILHATHNPVMQTFGKLIVLQCEQKGVFLGSLTQRRKSAKDHRAIYAAIEQKKGDVAGKLVYEHILNQ